MYNSIAMEIKSILELKNEKQNIEVGGWVVSNRGNKKILFITINDGSTFSNLQIVVKGISKFNDIKKLRIGAAVIFKGDIKFTPKAMQTHELIAKDIIYLNNSAEDFPLQKKNTSLETLRAIPYLRHRTNLYKAIMRIRSTICFAIHEYFQKENYTYIAAPIITSNDGEGAGESFYVKTKNKDEFFGKEATLGVTGQLHAEALAIGLGKVYTFAPTFRAENSHTKRHAAEFWMVEPEVPFYDLNQIIDVAYDSLLFVIKKVLLKNANEINYLSKYNKKDLPKMLNDLLQSKLNKINYKDAIKILDKVVKEKGKNVFENNDIKFGMDLATEHEKYLTDVHFKQPVAVMNYPKDIKAFYMYQNNDKKTVAAFDLLVPGVGEMVGGSQRESNYEKLINRMNELKLNVDEYKWYVDLRRFGYVGSSGYGLGLERMIMYITGMNNIRDVISFPRTPNSIIA